MAKITILPEVVASRIAAGEVVERPASALKELVENAIDAGARTIEVSLQAGGRDGLTVTDDGEGLAEDDLLLALERHATSKIRSDADLDRISTLGFRGEALPAIASVSRFRMTSRDESSDVATVVDVEGGRIASVRKEASPRGTRVEVQSIFYNAPARRKFLRSADTENRRCIEWIGRFAVAYPDIRFRMRSDERIVFDYAPVSSPLERAAQVFGRALTDGLLPLEAARAGLRIVGLCSGLEETRAHARDQHIFVNGRPVRDRLLSHAVATAYAEALPRGRHPVLILLLDVPPQSVDVNVHPSKSEVRFRAPSEVHAFLAASLRSVLRGVAAPPSFSLAEPDVAPPVDFGRSFGSAPMASADRLERRSAWIYGAGRPNAASDVLPGAEGFTYAPGRIPDPVSGGSDAHTALPPASAAERQSHIEHRGENGPATPLGQFLDSYILAHQGGALVVIDQHAAHERVLFERIYAPEGAAPGGAPPVQRLLTPISVELGPADKDRIEEWASMLGQAGFEAEAFGAATLLVRGVPAGVEHPDPGHLVREVLSDLRGSGVGAGADDASSAAARDRKVAATVACHAAIKVHFPLTAGKMSWLANALFRCHTPTTCPHGRPTTLRISIEDIERAFSRR